MKYYSNPVSRDEGKSVTSYTDDRVPVFLIVRGEVRTRRGDTDRGIRTKSFLFPFFHTFTGTVESVWEENLRKGNKCRVNYLDTVTIFYC